MQRRWCRRLIASLIVSGAFASALVVAAGGDAQLTIAPRILVIEQTGGMGRVASVSASVVGAGVFQVTDITYNCGPAPAVQLVGGGNGNAPFSVSMTAPRTIDLECPAGLAAGIHRCNFNVIGLSGSADRQFLGVCRTSGTPAVMANPQILTPFSAVVGFDSAPQTVIIRNAGGTTQRPIQLQTNDDNFVIAECGNATGCDLDEPLAPNETRAITVLCHPTSIGTKSGALFAMVGSFHLANPVGLTCNPQAGSGSGSGSGFVTLTPSAINLTNPVEVNGGMVPVTIEARNVGIGSASLALPTVADNGVIGASADWGQPTMDGCVAPPCALGPNQSTNIHLLFDPSSFNARPAVLTLNYNNGQQVTATLNGVGIGATLEAVNHETMIDFGVLATGQPGSYVLSLANRGNRATTAVFSGAVQPFSSPTMQTIPPGTSDVTIGCMSNTATDATATLTIMSADAPAITIALHCTVRSSGIVASPTSHAFGEVRKPEGAPLDVKQDVTVNRVGMGMPIGLQGVAFASGNPDPNLAVSALSGTQTPATFTITLTTKQIGAAFAESVVVTPTAGEAVAIPVTGRVVQPKLVAADSVSLGTFCVGRTTAATALRLDSTGTGTVMLQAAPTLGNVAAPDFALDPQSPTNFPSPLAEGTSASVLVTPKRSDVATSVSDVVTWSTDLGSFATEITASYIDTGGAIAPGTLDFGSALINVAPQTTQQVTLRNCSDTTLELVVPNDPTPFDVVGNEPENMTFPTILAPGAAATFEVAFFPRERGKVMRELTIMSTTGDRFVVTLLGEGIIDGPGGGGDDGNLDQTSFYACDCGTTSPSGTLAIGLSVIIVIIPRRRRRC